MPDQETNQSQPVSSPLGVDANTTVAPAKPEISETKPDSPKMRNLKEEEFGELSRKAAFYDLVANDPQAAQIVNDHFRAKTGRVTNKPDPKPESKDQAGGDDPILNHPVVKRIIEQNQLLTSRMSQMEVNSFRAAHPDMSELETDMARLVQQHGHSLEEAYAIARRAKPLAENNGSKPKPVARPTTETSSVTENSDSDDTDLVKARKIIDDPTATPRLDDAIAKAFKLAQLQHK